MKDQKTNEELYIEHLDKVIQDARSTEAHENIIKNLESLRERLTRCSGGEVTTPICGTGAGDAALV